MQITNQDCYLVLAKISAYQGVKQTIVDEVKNAICDSGEIEESLGACVKASNALSELQANIEGLQSEYKQFCA